MAESSTANTASAASRDTTDSLTTAYSTVAECAIPSPVLANLPPETPVYKYGSIRQMANVCGKHKNNAPPDKNSYVVFTSCDTRCLPARALQFMLCFVDIDYERLVTVVRVPTKFTLRLLGSLAATFRGAERIAGFDGSFSHVALSYIKTGKRLRECMARWQPDLDNERPNGRIWPSLALEWYLSERPPNLQDDVRFWLEESQGQTDMVMTVAFNIRMKVGMLRCWTRERNPATNRYEIASRQQCRVIVVEPDNEIGSHFGHQLQFDIPVINTLWDVSWISTAHVVFPKFATVRMICFPFGTEWPDWLGCPAVE